MTDEIKLNKTMTLLNNDYFSLDVQEKDSLLKGVNIYLKNNGDNIVKVTSDENSILIVVEKS